MDALIDVLMHRRERSGGGAISVRAGMAATLMTVVTAAAEQWPRG
jgi:hypothetical protein